MSLFVGLSLEPLHTQHIIPWSWVQSWCFQWHVAGEVSGAASLDQQHPMVITVTGQVESYQEGSCLRSAQRQGDNGKDEGRQWKLTKNKTNIVVSKSISTNHASIVLLVATALSSIQYSGEHAPSTRAAVVPWCMLQCKGRCSRCLRHCTCRRFRRGCHGKFQ